LKTAEHHLLTDLQLRPNDAKSLEGLGQLCIEQKRYREAAFAYGNMINVAPEVASARNQLALAYQRLGDPRTAAEQREIGAKLITLQDRETPLVTARDR